jgi:hypothetical protein
LRRLRKAPLDGARTRIIWPDVITTRNMHAKDLGAGPAC